MSNILIKGQYTTVGPDEIWKLYNNLNGIFRGSGNSSSPKLCRADGPRRSDFSISFDPLSGLEMVYPDSTKGMSFADSVSTLATKKLEGWVWIIPKGTKIPEGLVFNVKDYDHPLLNVSRKMSVLDLIAKLTQLASLMVPCHVKIAAGGKIVEKFPGSLSKVESK